MQAATPLDVDPARRVALAEEVKSLHEYARHVFSLFAAWWAFGCVANLTGFAVVAAFGYLHWFAAAVGTFLNFAGCGFCLMTGMRLVLIHDRVAKILHAQFPDREETPDSPGLPNPPTVGDMIRGALRNLRPRRLGSPLTPSSALPLSFYLCCILPAMLINCPSFGAMWLAARFYVPGSHAEMLEWERRHAAEAGAPGGPGASRETASVEARIAPAAPRVSAAGRFVPPRLFLAPSGDE